ncbi:hypothetical protein TNCV_1048521 [Trichonephila clavipes]|nr:hypothetical protein TNCV_1048521 [Trichonephila clavipes]
MGQWHITISFLSLYLNGKVREMVVTIIHPEDRYLCGKHKVCIPNFQSRCEALAFGCPTMNSAFTPLKENKTDVETLRASRKQTDGRTD